MRTCDGISIYESENTVRRNVVGSFFSVAIPTSSIFGEAEERSSNLGSNVELGSSLAALLVFRRHWKAHFHSAASGTHILLLLGRLVRL